MSDVMGKNKGLILDECLAVNYYYQSELAWPDRLALYDPGKLALYIYSFSDSLALKEVRQYAIPDGLSAFKLYCLLEAREDPNLHFWTPSLTDKLGKLNKEMKSFDKSDVNVNRKPYMMGGQMIYRVLEGQLQY